MPRRSEPEETLITTGGFIDTLHTVTMADDPVPDKATLAAAADPPCGLGRARVRWADAQGLRERLPC